MVRWGKLHVGFYDKEGYIRIYFFRGRFSSEMYCAHYSLNSDNSLNERNTGTTLLPVEMGHEIAKHSDKIITYLMLKRK